jgi:hypothetical protein
MGCGDVDGVASDDAGAETDALRGHHGHHPLKGSTAGSSTGGATSTIGGATSATGGATSATGGSPGMTGGTSSSGVSSSSCSICATTQSCCLSVDAGALCTFSADTCESLDPLRQSYYASDCLMVLRTIISAQAMNSESMNRRVASTACVAP